MTISWLGHFCFKLQTSGAKSQTLLVNPYPKEAGLVNLAQQKPDLVIAYETKIPKGDFLIDAPGEYETKGIYVHGVGENGNTIYFIEIDGFKCLYVGAMAEPHMIPEIFSDIAKKIDILFLPIGGDFTLGKEKHKVLDSDAAAKLARQLSPKIIIPMHFKVPGLALKLEGPEKFLKIFGKGKLEPQERILIKEKDLANKEKEIILLKP